MTSTIDYLGMRFLDANLTGVRAAFREALRGRFGYVVTPNVDHVVSYHRGDAALREVYDGALFQICDSRVLAGLASLSGLHLTPCPGSDLTQDLLERPLFPAMRIAVIGPDMEAFRDLQQRFPSISLTLIPSASKLTIGSSEWRETVARTAGTRWDLLLVCLSFPKEEFFARDLGRAGRVHGLALCVGASVDFLTGRQKRAPEFLRNAGCEWLYRLASDPRRMAARYLQRGPAVFAIAGREWLRLRQDGPDIMDRTASPKRVLFLTTVMPHERMTGGEIASMNFIDGLKASGCEVEVIAYRREGQEDELPVGFLSPVDWPIESAGRPVRSAVWMASALRAPALAQHPRRSRRDRPRSGLLASSAPPTRSSDRSDRSQCRASALRGTCGRLVRRCEARSSRPPESAHLSARRRAASSRRAASHGPRA